MRRNFIKNIIFPAVIFSFGLMVSAVIVVQAQTASTEATSTSPDAEQGITFPIPELGNCANKSDCRAYCNGLDHMDACISFAKAHGLMNKEEADRAEKFRGSLETNSAPGGCKTSEECQTFCSKTENLEACVKFAQTQGFKNKEVEEGGKVLAYIKNGGQLPGGCNSKESCQAYCGDFSHAQECFDFAQKAGIHQTNGKAEGGAGDIPPGQFQKFLELVKNGQTPGGCKSKDGCEVYCKVSTHLDECLKFGQEVGFIQNDQAEKFRKLGGKGPGGCDSQESCSAYCNNSTHQKECFAFAKEHELISPEELDRAETGMVRLREGLSQAPPEVVACLKSELGPDAIDDIQAGKLTPGPDTAEELHDCFEKFGHRSNPEDAFKHAPPEVTACLKEKVGADFDKISSGQMMPTPEMADAFRVCFQKSQLDHFVIPSPGVPCRGDECLEYCKAKNIPQSDCEKFIHPGFQGGPGSAPPSSGMNQFLRSAPPEVAACLKEKLGDTFEKLQSGEVQFQSEMKDAVKSCFEQFRPNIPQGQNLKQGQQNDGDQQKQIQPSQLPLLPPQIAECLKEKLGADILDKLKQGQLSTADIKEQAQTCFQGLQINLQTSSTQNSPLTPGEPGVPPKPYQYPEGQYPQNNYPASPSGGTFPPPCPSGQYWDGKSCMTPTSDDPTALCAKSGGTWTGSTCKMP